MLCAALREDDRSLRERTAAIGFAQENERREALLLASVVSNEPLQSTASPQVANVLPRKRGSNMCLPPSIIFVCTLFVSVWFRTHVLLCLITVFVIKSADDKPTLPRSKHNK